MNHLNLRVVLGASIALLFSACVTHIKTDITTNPPPAEKFSAFTKFEMTPLAMPAPYAGQAANEKARAKIQQDISVKMDPLLAQWNAAGASSPLQRTLLIEPVISEIKFINATSRVWAGAFAGSSAVILNAKITEKETGKVIATPTFYARAAAMGGAWTFGSTDNVMLARIAGRFTDYLTLNYASAVGGPSGAEPPKS